jgi:hypothetical protein
VNGEAAGLSSDGSDAGTYNLFVAGTNVYAAGFEAPVGGWQQAPKGVLWANGHPQPYSAEGQPPAYIYSVFVFGRDVFVAGRERNIATIWKNGKPLYRTEQDGMATFNSVFVQPIR